MVNETVTLDYSGAKSWISPHELDHYAPFVRTAHTMLHEKKAPGADFLGWLNLPQTYDREEFARILSHARRIQKNSDVLIVVGIGGSYLGARAAIEMLQHAFYNYLDKEKRRTPQIFFAGQNLSATYLKQLLDIIEKKDVSLNVISKSGTTTEPAIAFRVLRRQMEKKYGREEAARRIYATTDRRKGALKALAEENGYETFVIPDDVGGRYSVLTAVGLLPIAAAGLDIEAMMKGAFRAQENLTQPDLFRNPAYQYAVLRHSFYQKGKTIELLVNYEPSLHSFAEWWKQLFGESEGKDGKGLFPVAGHFSTDLHSLGQYIQQGRRHLLETVLHVEQSKEDLRIEAESDDRDGLNYLAEKTLSYVNEQAFRGTWLAHTEGGVPNLVIGVPKLDEFHFGYLVYFFEKACAMSGLLLGVNPFDQPGVEAYKQNMFALLKKPGFAERGAELEKKFSEKNQ